MSDTGATIDPDRATPPMRLDAPQLPAPPRPLTPRARRRSWAEMPVRIWLILTIVVGIITAGFTISRISEARNDRWLILHGTDVVAKLGKTGGNSVPKRQLRTEALPSSLHFTLDGKAYHFDVVLPARAGHYAQEGADFPIKVDPSDPQGRWTEETQPKPWSQELTVVGFLLPLVVTVAVVTLIRRRGVLRIWRDGELMEGQVVETRHVAAAPLSRLVRYTLSGGQDRRIFTTSQPAAAGVPETGESIWIIALPANPARAIVAKLYEERMKAEG